MSDDFDREAEKEKLRRQFEREEETRRATQHMSDLLLKGATMTNKHCGECGDPIFRYDGQEFCPTCGNEVGGEGEGADAPEAETPATTDESGADAADADSGVDRIPPDGPAEIDVETPDPAPDAPDRGEAAETPTAPPASRSPETPDAPPAAEGGDLADARASLVRTLVSLSRRAEATDDVRRARDLLSAAREAAEAIDAIDSVGR